jgi:2-oxoglutarate dehydrogenase E2 component (dihydrolipoamide succinyltransferase)
MSSKVVIPPLGESVTEAVLLRWIKNEGDSVAVDDPLCELETDKANVELPAPAAGTLHQLKKAGDTVRIGDTVAEVGAGAAKAARPAEKAPAEKPAPAAAAKSAPSPAAKPAPAPAPAAAPARTAAEVDNLSPSVRRLVKEHGVDPATLQGTGPRGRIVKEDVMAAVGSHAEPSPGKGLAMPDPQQATSLVPASGDGTRRVAMTKIRKRIAERLVTAQHTAAMLTTFNEIDMSAVISLREKYKGRFTDLYGVSLGFMSFFARACAVGLKEFPSVNASLEGDDILYHDYVHLGIAVSTERGLVVPVLRHAENMSFGRIESEIKRMAGAAREGKLGLQELGGGTFTITNGGVFGSLLSTPILNPPQSGILGLHAIQKRPIGVDDRIELRPMMYIALSYDHRLVDGKDSVSFLVRVKQLLEDPARLMLEV